MKRIQQIRTDFKYITLAFICVNPLNLCNPWPNLMPSLSILNLFYFIQIGSSVFQNSHTSMFV
jgi:hypothetical protein